MLFRLDIFCKLESYAMKINFIIFTVLCVSYLSNSFAFTLISDPPTKFSSGEITINVSGNSCSNLSRTPEELLDLAVSAAERYWNSVSTSSIELKRGSVLTSVDLSSSDQGNAMLKSSYGSILIGCSSVSFSAGVVGTGSIYNDNTGIRGAVRINNTGSPNLAGYSSSILEAILAHEMGHAIGIHHSDDPVALMYYSVGGKVQDNMTIDDWDAVTYLYPNEKEVGGLAGSCGSLTIIDDDRDHGMGIIVNWALSFLIGFGSLLVYRYGRLWNS